MKNKSLKVASLKYNIVLNICYTAMNILFPLLTFPYASRVLGSAGMGKVSFFSSIASYGTMIASLGIATYGIRATAAVRNDRTKLSKVTAELFTINFTLSIVVCVCLGLGTLFINRLNQDYWLMSINILWVIASSFGLDWFYSGLEQYQYITLRSLLFKIISVILVFTLVRTSGDYIKYAGITVFSIVGSCILNFWHAHSFITFKGLGKLNFKIHLKPTLLLFASVLAVSVYTNLDTVLLGFMKNDTQVGFFTVAVKLKTLLLAMINAVSAVLLPRLSFYSSSNRNAEFHRIINISVKAVCLVTIPIVLFFQVAAKPTINIIGGPGFGGSVLVMQILMPILFVSGLSNITGNQILLPRKQDAHFLTAVSFGAIVDLLLNLYLIPEFGAIGAAISTLIAELTQLSIQLYFARTMLNHAFNFRRIIYIFVSSLAAATISGIVGGKIHYGYIYTLAIMGLAFSIVYLLAIFFLYRKSVIAFVTSSKKFGTH